jgi:hypothetical protein
MAGATVRSVARGILGVAMIQAVLAGIGFLAVGVPGAGLWALVALFLSVIQLGMLPIGIPIIIYVFYTSEPLVAIIFTVYIVFVGLLDNFLKPLLLGRGVPVPMLIIFIGAIGGFLSAGIVGLFVWLIVADSAGAGLPASEMEFMSSISVRHAGTLAMAVAVSLVYPASARAAEGKSFEIYGFAMADFIQDFNGGCPPNGTMRSVRPGSASTSQFGGDGQSSISVKQSRFGVLGSMPLTRRVEVRSDFKFEFDLFGTGVDAGQTTIRLRHAYGEWGQILAGQTHSLFMDIDVFPNTIDYWGPTGMVFYRNVQLRWTPYKGSNSHFAVAIERPGNDIDSGNLRLIDGLEDLEVQNDEEMPDITAQFRYSADWGHVQAGRHPAPGRLRAAPTPATWTTAARPAGAST